MQFHYVQCHFRNECLCVLTVYVRSMCLLKHVVLYVAEVFCQRINTLCITTLTWSQSMLLLLHYRKGGLTIQPVVFYFSLTRGRQCPYHLGVLLIIRTQTKCTQKDKYKQGGFQALRNKSEQSHLEKIN